MSGAATRSRWLELRAAREAARRGRDLLEEKREALVREVARRLLRRDEASRKAASALEEARASHRAARTEVGGRTLEAAALGQAGEPSALVRETSVFGLPLPTLVARVPPWRPGWGPGGAAAALDRAGAAYARALPVLVELAAEELAVRALRRGLRKTSQRVNGLGKIILPDLDRNIRDVSSAIEEEERDEAFRRRRWLGARRAPASEVF